MDKKTRVLVLAVLFIQFIICTMLYMFVSFSYAFHPDLQVRLTIIICGSILFALSTAVFVLGFWAASTYFCSHTGRIFRPKFWVWVVGMHTPKSRYLKCPHCNRWHWCTHSVFAGEHKEIKKEDEPPVFH